MAWARHICKREHRMSQSGFTQQLHALSATDIVQAIRNGHTTCEAVARACLEHIAVREPEVQAWQYLNADQVIARHAPWTGVGSVARCMVCRSGSRTLLIPTTCRQSMVR